MKKRTAVLVGIFATLTLITSVGLIAKMVIKTPMIKKPIQKLPKHRVKYAPRPSAVIEEVGYRTGYRTMLPGAKLRPLPMIKDGGYVITGEEIMVKPVQHAPSGKIKYIITGRKIVATPMVSKEQLEQEPPIETIEETESIMLEKPVSD